MRSITTGLALALALMAVGCGDNPEKTVGGVSLRKEFLASNHGDYVSFNNEKLVISAEGDAVQGRNEPNKITLWVTPDLQLELQTERGTRTRIIMPEAIKSLNPRYGDKSEISFSCFFGREGVLEDFVRVPEKKKGLRYDWEMENMMNKGAKYLASFGFAEFAFQEIQEVTKAGVMAEAFPQEDLNRRLETICRDSKPEAYEIQSTFGVISYTATHLEIIPGSRYNSKSYDPYHVVHQRFWVKSQVKEIDLTERFWSVAQGLFLGAERGYNYEKSRYQEWQVDSPREELHFDEKRKTLTWKREELSQSGNCGFELNFAIPRILLRHQEKDHLGYMDAEFKFESGQRFGSTTCRADRMIEQLKANPEKVRLVFKVREDTGNGISVGLIGTDDLSLTLGHALPWSEAEKRLTPKYRDNY
ncbi:MAG: hypothetical protein H6624_02880 [Bdellovibrionaceae bacterium]|nr:hypothetical protein [Bdellovibrionales bacterium]MCB9083257.1 hypothetical protein [Pseudobdellovibrionaceae bacterium]